MRLAKTAALVAAAAFLVSCGKEEKAVEQKAESAAKAVESEAQALEAREAAIDA